MKHFKQMDISTEKKYRLINYNFKLILFVIAAMIMGSFNGRCYDEGAEKDFGGSSAS